jgi:hypothetical protein
MLATLKPRKPAWIVARRGACLRFGVRPNAFGNALGGAFVDNMRPTSGGLYALSGSGPSGGFSQGSSGEGMRWGGVRGGFDSTGGGVGDGSAMGDWGDGYLIAANANGAGVSTDNAPIDRFGRVNGSGAGMAAAGSIESLRQPDGTYRVEISGTSANADTALTDAQQSAMAAGYGPMSQEAAAAIRGGAYGAYEPSFKSFSNPRIQELFTGSFGNKLVDEFGRQEYIDNTLAKATDVVTRIDRGEISAREGAYEAAGFRDAEALRVRETSTTPESLRDIAQQRGDKPTDALVERATNPDAMRDYVDSKLYPKAEAKLVRQAQSPTPDDVYREIAESSGRPNAEWNEKAAKAAEVAGKVRAVGQVIGRTATVVGGVLDAASLASEIRTSVRTGNYDNTYQEGSRIAGGWAGAWAGGQVGAATGAAFGGAVGTVFPVVGNVIGVAVGGVVGGLAGGAAGYFAGSKLGTSVYNFFRH